MSWAPDAAAPEAEEEAEADVPEVCPVAAAEALAAVPPAEATVPEADAPWWEAAVSELVVVMAACAVAEERRPPVQKMPSWLR